jgi:hypothetical protein
VSKGIRSLAVLLLAAATTLFVTNTGRADEQHDPLVRDRVAIERVYYNHRTGAKPPFDQMMPRELAEKLVRQDRDKEALLKKIYHVEITDAQTEAEVRRIDASTRAPDILAELKAALDNDAARFARTVAKPIVVERILRDKFDNDDTLHAAQRHRAEIVRAELLAAKQDRAEPDMLVMLLRRLGSNEVTEATWELEKPPQERPHNDKELMEAQRHFGPQAQILSPPRDTEGKPKLYFQDLPSQLQQVLGAQLRKSGDISAVIETPADFRLYLCERTTATTLAAATLSISKRSYEQWLMHQSNGYGTAPH